MNLPWLGAATLGTNPATGALIPTGSVGVSAAQQLPASSQLLLAQRAAAAAQRRR